VCLAFNLNEGDSAETGPESDHPPYFIFIIFFTLLVKGYEF
jgi:hypothetical protein